MIKERQIRGYSKEEEDRYFKVKRGMAGIKQVMAERKRIENIMNPPAAPVEQTVTEVTRRGRFGVYAQMKETLQRRFKNRDMRIPNKKQGNMPSRAATELSHSAAVGGGAATASK
jgi:hypothetical protein